MIIIIIIITEGKDKRNNPFYSIYIEVEIKYSGEFSEIVLLGAQVELRFAVYTVGQMVRKGGLIWV